MKLKRSFLFISIFVGLMCLFDCSQNDTVAPNADPIYGGPSQTWVQQQSTTIMDDMCAASLKCSSQNTMADFNNCTIQFSKTSGLGEALGLQKGKYGTYLEVIQAEISGAIVANTTASNKCVSDINALTCSSLPSGGFEIPSSPGSCPNVFSK